MNPVVQVSGICDHIPMYFMRLSRTPQRVAAVVALTLAGCEAPPSPELVTHRLSQPLEGPCATDSASLSQGEFIGDVSNFGATISGPDISTPLQASGTGAITIDEVPAGENRVIALFGLANGQARWRGVSKPTTIVKDVPQTINVVLAAVSDFSCARTASGAHAFHTATALNDGTILIVGGAETMADASATCASCLKAVATRSVIVYDPQTGVLVPVGSLAQGRMFHTATKLPDGRVVVAGGTGDAFFFKTTNATRPFPISPESPVVSIEVYDPSTKQFTSAGSDPGGARIFAAATTTLEGEVLITGGVPSKGQAGIGSGVNDLGNALKTTTVCSGNIVACRSGPAMVSARAGHIAFTTDPQGVYLWGGSVDAAADGFHVEYLQPAGGAFVRLVRQTMFAGRNVFFAAGSQYVDYRFLIAGGLTRNSGGIFTADLANLAYIFDVGADDKDLAGSPVKGGVTRPIRMQSPRIFASAAGMPDEATGIVVGGFEADSIESIDWTPSADLDLFNEASVADAEPKMTTLDVGGPPRTMRQPRGAATATPIGDGTVVIVGGYGGNNAVAETAEIYADRKTPPQAAEFVQ